VCCRFHRSTRFVTPKTPDQLDRKAGRSGSPGCCRDPAGARWFWKGRLGGVVGKSVGGHSRGGYDVIHSVGISSSEPATFFLTSDKSSIQRFGRRGSPMVPGLDACHVWWGDCMQVSRVLDIHVFSAMPHFELRSNTRGRYPQRWEDDVDFSCLVDLRDNSNPLLAKLRHYGPGPIPTSTRRVPHKARTALFANNCFQVASLQHRRIPARHRSRSHRHHDGRSHALGWAVPPVEEPNQPPAYRRLEFCPVPGNLDLPVGVPGVP